MENRRLAGGRIGQVQLRDLLETRLRATIGENEHLAAPPEGLYDLEGGGRHPMSRPPVGGGHPGRQELVPDSSAVGPPGEVGDPPRARVSRIADGEAFLARRGDQDHSPPIGSPLRGHNPGQVRRDGPP